MHRNFCTRTFAHTPRHQRVGGGEGSIGRTGGHPLTTSHRLKATRAEQRVRPVRPSCLRCRHICMLPVFSCSSIVDHLASICMCSAGLSATAWLHDTPLAGSASL